MTDIIKVKSDIQMNSFYENLKEIRETFKNTKSYEM